MIFVLYNSISCVLHDSRFSVSSLHADESDCHILLINILQRINFIDIQ